MSITVVMSTCYVCQSVFVSLWVLVKFYVIVASFRLLLVMIYGRIHQTGKKKYPEEWRFLRRSWTGSFPWPIQGGVHQNNHHKVQTVKLATNVTCLGPCFSCPLLSPLLFFFVVVILMSCTFVKFRPRNRDGLCGPSKGRLCAWKEAG